MQFSPIANTKKFSSNIASGRKQNQTQFDINDVFNTLQSSNAIKPDLVQNTNHTNLSLGDEMSGWDFLEQQATLTTSNKSIHSNNANNSESTNMNDNPATNPQVDFLDWGAISDSPNNLIDRPNNLHHVSNNIGANTITNNPNSSQNLFDFGSFPSIPANNNPYDSSKNIRSPTNNPTDPKVGLRQSSLFQRARRVSS